MIQVNNYSSEYRVLFFVKGSSDPIVYYKDSYLDSLKFKKDLISQIKDCDQITIEKKIKISSDSHSFLSNWMPVKDNFINI